MHQLQTLRSEFIAALSSRYSESEAAAMFRNLHADLPAGSGPVQLKARVEELLPDLLTGRPFQYVTGQAWFYGLPFTVNEAVLIPRPETEELVQKIIHNHSSDTDLRILDVGTGSGCIAIALKHKLPKARVHAVDVSGTALEVARKNSADLQAPVEFMHADILEWESIIDPDIWFDVIVSNPPYITPAEKLDMEAHVLNFEPEEALFVPEEAPLLFYQYIADCAEAHLREGGKVYFEVNQHYGQDVKHLLERKGYKPVELLKDMQGVDRMIVGTKPKGQAAKQQ